MPYKDKSKAKDAVERFRERQGLHKGLHKAGITGITPAGITGVVTPEGIARAVPENYGLVNCTCRHCQQNRKAEPAWQLILNHGAHKSVDQLDTGEINRVSLPGDIDYQGLCKLPIKHIESGMND